VAKKPAAAPKNKLNQQPTAAPSSGAATPPVIRDRRALEDQLYDLHRLLDAQEFKDIDEANAFLAKVMAKGGRIEAPPATTPLERAQEIMYDAWAAQGEQRLELAQQALAISADCADAYVLLAEDAARTTEEAHALYTKGVAAGERALGPRRFKDLVGSFWGVLETRPYMRARAGLADSLWQLGHRDAAIAHYQDMLRLNPHDNQGIRYILLSCLIQSQRDADARKLLARFPDDPTADWQYSGALLAFRSEGDSAPARAQMIKALQINPFVPLYMTGAKPMPSELPDRVGFGDESEAQVYVAEFGLGWLDTPGAPQWLRSTLARDPQAKNQVAAAAFSMLSIADLKSDLVGRWRRDQDAKPLSLDTKLQAALNKCPAQWIEGMATTLGYTQKGIKRDKIAAIIGHLTHRDKLNGVVASLQPQERAALALVMKKDWAKYGELTRRFGTEEDDGWFWDEEPPTSVVGRLRLRGLLFVGTAGIQGRNYKVAVIPIELRPLLHEIMAP
jgi:tetratricopeptide (TPR) repeat protein